ncbi:lipoprotein [uncultured Paludibaculum sp.]|uniref:lipoprotein n=1 Tax=uncultured Paludibaculum sp. TaxID=1765020 RepID=UPI002AAC04D5|nr:hypothetical protein [uncultured Paludibaculum sp.]
MQALTYYTQSSCARLVRIGQIVALSLALTALSGCGRSGDSAGVRAPSRSGDVWEIDRAAGRPDMPGAVLAYVNGLNLIVVDGNDIYAGMTPLKAETRSDGGRAIKLSSGLEAVLTPDGPDRLQLRFSSGESIGLRKKAEAK